MVCLLLSRYSVQLKVVGYYQDICTCTEALLVIEVLNAMLVIDVIHRCHSWIEMLVDTCLWKLA